jgi:hypothetical protein
MIMLSLLAISIGASTTKWGCIHIYDSSNKAFSFPFIVLTITWLLRYLVVALIYSSVSNTFVRNKPAASNIALLLFETWNMGNALGYVLMRSVRVLVIAVFYLGRLDKWVLADGVGEFLVFHPDVSVPLFLCWLERRWC